MNRARPLRRTLMTLVVVLGACSQEEASPVPTGPASTLPAVTAATTTSTIPPETTTTVEATTTSAVPTTVAPTTVAPPSGEPVDATIPIWTGGGGGDGDVGWLSLGSWAATGWAPPFAADGTPVDPDIAAGSTLTIVGLQAGASTGTTGGPAESCFDGRVGPTIDAAVNAPSPPGFGYSAIALPAIWPLQPRPVVVVDAAIPAYQAAGEAIFADDPVDGTQGAVEQIVLTDLDGDGDEESLVVFEHVQDSILGTPGDLSAVLMIDTATGQATTLASSFIGPFEEPPATDVEPARPIIDRYRVLGVADLNGDGVMEVVVHSWYFEGAAVLVYEYDGTALDEVLSTGCGA